MKKRRRRKAVSSELDTETEPTVIKNYLRKEKKRKEPSLELREEKDFEFADFR
jgi:hypothetical protein